MGWATASGLEVHEAPGLGRSGDDLSQATWSRRARHYRQGDGGVRLEDLLLVTEDGTGRSASPPYELAP